jgi:hypothetical protein
VQAWLDTPSIVIHGKTVKVERFAFHHSQLFVAISYALVDGARAQ